MFDNFKGKHSCFPNRNPPANCLEKKESSPPALIKTLRLINSNNSISYYSVD